MRKYLILTVLMLVLLFSFCSVKSYKSEFEFANKLAREGLWKEAHLRWQRANAQGKDSAALHNNMAIALETMGKRDEAEKEYKIALRMSPDNRYIKSNYEHFKKKIDDKKDKKGKKPRKKFRGMKGEE